MDAKGSMASDIISTCVAPIKNSRIETKKEVAISVILDNGREDCSIKNNLKKNLQ